MSNDHSATYTLEYPYTRTTGPVVGRFLTALRDGKLLGVRSGGRVVCPPIAPDPATGRTLADPEFVEVGPAGTVTSWTWIAAPRPQHPLQRPFAFALIQLDGATTSLLHAIDAPGESAMKTGMRVAPRWRAESRGGILDIECFEPEASQ